MHADRGSQHSTVIRARYPPRHVFTYACSAHRCLDFSRAFPSAPIGPAGVRPLPCGFGKTISIK